MQHTAQAVGGLLGDAGRLSGTVSLILAAMLRVDGRAARMEESGSGSHSSSDDGGFDQSDSRAGVRKNPALGPLNRSLVPRRLGIAEIDANHCSSPLGQVTL